MTPTERDNMTVCPACRQSVKKARFCPECGTPLPFKKCPGCGEIVEDRKFCGNCGASLTGNAASTPPPQTVTFPSGMIGVNMGMMGRMGCTQPPEKTVSEKIPAERITGFSRLRIGSCPCTAITYVWLLTKTDDGLLAEHYYAPNFDHDKKGRVVSVVSHGSEAYEAILALLRQHDVGMWNGFWGTPPAGIRDGETCEFFVVLPDGTEIRAAGNNHMPDGFSAIRNAAAELCRERKSE